MEYLFGKQSFKMGFNRYMVECEFCIQIYCCAAFIVLIDTWWNVNMRLLRSPTLLLLVLIDTWWNVNTFISLADTVLQPF